MELSENISLLPESSEVFFLNFFLMFIFDRERERERERQSMSGGGAERRGDTESEAGSRLRAVGTGPDAGLEPTDQLRDHDLSQSRTLNRLSHPGAPLVIQFFKAKPILRGLAKSTK